MRTRESEGQASEPTIWHDLNVWAACRQTKCPARQRAICPVPEPQQTYEQQEAGGALTDVGTRGPGGAGCLTARQCHVKIPPGGLLEGWRTWISVTEGPRWPVTMSEASIANYGSVREEDTLISLLSIPALWSRQIEEKGGSQRHACRFHFPLKLRDWEGK